MQKTLHQIKTKYATVNMWIGADEDENVFLGFEDFVYFFSPECRNAETFIHRAQIIQEVFDAQKKKDVPLICIGNETVLVAIQEKSRVMAH